VSKVIRIGLKLRPSLRLLYSVQHHEELPMILRGLLDQSLGGFVCVRGYAPLGELARASHADLDYQRELIKTHRETVMRFLRNRKDLFFPELILSCVLGYDFTKPRAISGMAPLANVLAGKRFRSNVDGISIAVRKLSFKGGTDTRAPTVFQIVTISIPDELPEGKPPPLFRIDGNHRLSAADKEAEFNDIVAPYCIILFEAGDEGKRNSKTIFHNINSKSIPLTSEENLKIILDDEALFPDETLKEPTSFGWPFLLTRRARAALSADAIPALKHVLAQPRTVLIELFTLLLHKRAIAPSEKDLPKILKCLSDVGGIYAAEDDLRANDCAGLFHAFVYFCLTDAEAGQLKPFQHWVRGNHLAALKTIDAPALIEIFERVHAARKRTIFVSMEFSAETEPVFETIKKAVEQINKDCRPRIKIEPLRIDKLNKGYSYTITDEILTAIEDSGLLIADLTNGNKNVYHEVGYLMGLNRGRHLRQDNFVLIVRAQSKAQVEKDVAFNLKGVSQIRFKETIDLESSLTSTIKKYYGLP
jgi:hypothetical protein